MFASMAWTSDLVDLKAVLLARSTFLAHKPHTKGRDGQFLDLICVFCLGLEHLSRRRRPRGSSPRCRRCPVRRLSGMEAVKDQPVEQFRGLHHMEMPRMHHVMHCGGP